MEEHTELRALVERALERRADLAARLSREGTDAYRLFRGAAEGRPGLSIDRYGPLVLAQTFREPLTVPELEALQRTFADQAGFAHEFVWNHRPAWRTRTREQFHRPTQTALQEHVARELGVNYAIRARHRGQDPWLFLDLRAGRRVLAENARDRSVLNLFAYTGSAGICALVHGAKSALNVDFARSSLEVAFNHLEMNGVDPTRMQLVFENCLPVMRQLAGLPVKGRGAERPYVRVAPARFDVVVLDPPAFAKTAFGAVDVVRDYPSLFKPALLATAEEGLVIATNHVVSVSASEFANVLRRTAEKAGRPLKTLEILHPEADCPAAGLEPPLKIAVARVS